MTESVWMISQTRRPPRPGNNRLRGQRKIHWFAWHFLFYFYTHYRSHDAALYLWIMNDAAQLTRWLWTPAMRRVLLAAASDAFCWETHLGRVQDRRSHVANGFLEAHVPESRECDLLARICREVANKPSSKGRKCCFFSGFSTHSGILENVAQGIDRAV